MSSKYYQFVAIFFMQLHIKKQTVKMLVYFTTKLVYRRFFYLQLLFHNAYNRQMFSIYCYI